MSGDDDFRVTIHTPDMHSEMTISSAAEWDALVTLLQQKVKYPLQTREVCGDD